MDKNDKIKHEVEKTLGLFNNKKSLPPNPYFYTRVKQRINEKARKRFSIYDLLKPAFFTVLVILNLTTAIWYTSSDILVSDSSNNVELVDILKSDFNLDGDNNESLIFE